MANYQGQIQHHHHQQQHQYRSPFGDTTYTKVFVGGLAWETPTDKMRAYFEQFGDILEAVIICDKLTGKSKGYGFVTFRDPAAASRACVDANPMIDGRRANCNIASFGRPKPSPPRGRNPGGVAQGQSSSSSSFNSGMPTPQQTAPPTYFYQPYGYPAYTPYGYQGVYNQQLQQSQYYAAAAAAQFYGGASSSSTPLGGPIYYLPNSRTGLSSTAPAQRVSGHSYVYYPQMDAPLTPFPNPAAPAFPSARQLVPSSSSSGEPQAPESTSPEADAVVIHSEGPSTT